MSTNIDTNIVQMKFDNEQFEKKCAQSMSTLDKLKAKIHESTSGKALSGLGDSANSINLSHLEKSVDAVAKRFTFLGNIAFKIKDQIADAFLGLAKTIAVTVPNIIKQGGWERAMNIERAKFQLEGLHVAWKDIYDDIDYAVSGTAYGLDAAANAASQLVASGVEVGQSMKDALRAISGVAAMTNASYEEISPIFTTVAGQGKLMTMQLRQLESRGLNAAAVLGEAMGKTEAEIRDMVTKGEIDFAEFSKAMDDAFGEHAKDANRTFTGVTANIRAALKKIGADFSTPIIEQDGPVVKALQVLRERINDIRANLGPMTKVWISFINEYARGAERLLRSLDMSFTSDLAVGMANAFQGLLSVLKPLGYALKDIFASQGIQTVNDFARAFAEFSRKLILSKNEMEDLRATFRGLFAIFDIAHTILKQFIGALIGVAPETVNIRAEILKVTGSLGDLITYISLVIKQVDIVKPTIKGITTALELLAAALFTAGVKIYEFVRYVKNLEVTQKIVSKLGDAMHVIIGAVSLLVTKIRDLVKAIAAGDFESLGFIGDAIIFIKNGILGIVDAISQLGLVQDIITKISEVFDKFKKAADDLFGKDDKSGVNSQLNGMVTTIEDAEVPLASFAGVIGDDLEPSTRRLGVTMNGTTAAITDFIEKIPVARIVAVALAGALFVALYRVSTALNNVGKGVKNVGSFLVNLQRTGLIGLISGSGQYARTPNHILDIGIAIGILAASLVALSRVNTKKLYEALDIMAKMATGYVGVLFAMSTLEKWLGFSGALDTIGVGMVEIAAAIAVLAGAFALLTNIDFAKVEQTQKIMGGLIGAMTAMTVIVSKMGVTFSGAGLAFVGLSTSMLILVAALEALNSTTPVTMENIGSLVAKLAALAVLAAEMVGIAKICDMIGGKSFMRLSTSMLALVVSMRILYSMIDYLPEDFMSKLVDTIQKFAADIRSITFKALEIARDVAQFAIAMAGIVIVFTVIWKGTGALLEKIRGITENVSKIRKYQDHHKKALNTLATAALVVSIGATVAMLAGLLVLLTKANLTKNRAAFDAAVGAILGIFASLTVMLIAVNKTAKEGLKGAGGAALGMVLAFATLVATTIGVAAYIYSILTSEGSWKAKAAEAAIAVGALVIVLGVFALIGKAIGQLKGLHFEKSTSTGIIAMVTSIAVITGAVLVLSKQMTDLKEIGKIVGSFVILAAAMEGFVLLLKQLSKIPQYSFKPSTAKVINSMCLAIGTIAGSLVLLARYGESGPRLIASFVALTGTFAAFVALVKVLNNTEWKEDTLKAMKIIVAEVISISTSLGLLSYFMEGKEKTMLAAMIALDGIFAAFAGMNIALSKTKFTINHFKAIKFIIAEVLVIAGTLAGLTYAFSKSQVSDIQYAIGGLISVLVAFSAVNIILTAFKFNAAYVKAVKGIISEVISIGVALSAIIFFADESTKIMEAAKAMSLVMGVFGAMAAFMGTVNAPAFKTLLGIAIDAVAIGAALSMLTGFEGSEAIDAAVAMSIVMGVFGTAAVVMGKTGSDTMVGMVTMIGVAAAALIVAKSLSMLAQYDFDSITAAWEAILYVMGGASLLAVGLGLIIQFSVPGAIALALIGAATIPFAISLGMAADALTVFLPIAESFISNVMTTLVDLSPEMPATALGLTEMAGGLALIAIAGVALTTGAIGLLAAAGGLSLLIPACLDAKDIDLIPLANGLAALVIPGAAMALVGPALTVLAAGMAVATPAIMAFTVAVAGLSAVLGPALNKSMEEFTNKAKDAKKWGSDLVQNFIAGLKSKLNSLKGAVVEMAQLIKSYIGFTTPDMGPLSDFDTYGADMIMNFSDSMMGKMPYLEGDLKDATSTISSAFSGDNSLIANAGASMVDSFSAPILSGLDRLEQITGMKLNSVRSMFGTIQGFAYSAAGAKGNDSNKSTVNDMDLARKEQIESRKKLTQATKKATIAEEDFGKAVKGSGSAAKEEKEEIRDLTDAFKTLEKGTKVSLSMMANNLKANVKAHYEWVKDVKELGNMGYDKAIIDWVKKSGDAGHETVKALKSATAEEAADLNQKLAVWLKMDEETEKILSDDFAGEGAVIAQSYIDSMGSTFDSKLAETLQSALDPFGEFNNKAEKGAAKLLENMKSQVEGFQTWGGMINELQHRNLNQNALEYLIGLGTSGYEDVTAIFQMTDDQINEFNQLWAQQENLGNEIAGGIQHEMNLIAAAVNEGFPAGIDPTVAYDTLQNFAQEGLNGAKSKGGFDVNSPSKKMIAIAKSVTEGLRDGLTSHGHIAYEKFIYMANHCVDVTDDILNYDAGVTIGEDLMKGLKSGIERGSDSVFTAIETVCSSLIEKANQRLERRSPSKVFARIGRDVDRGLAVGIDDNTGIVTSSMDNLAVDTISCMSQVIATIAENVNSEMSDISPVITPRLDLTSLQNGKSFINSMFGGSYSTQLATSIGPYSNPVTTSINNLDFTPTSNADVVSAIGRLRNDINVMAEQMASMQVVLDGRTVVGELAPAMDIALGTNATRAGRGN